MRILFIITSANKIGKKKYSTGYEFSEVAEPYFVFVDKGFIVDFASIGGGIPPEDGYNGAHQISKKFREGEGFKRLNLSTTLDEVNIDLYDAIFFPGGLGPMVDMVDNPLVKKVIRTSYEGGKIIGAVCHGPVALLNVILSDGSNLLAGKRINSFTKEEEKAKSHLLGEMIPFMLDEALKEQGALFAHTKPFEPYIIVDGSLVTGQNPASAFGLASKMIELLLKQ